LLRCGEAESLFEQALEPAERAGDERLVALLLRGLGRAAVFGPRPARSALERCEALLERAREIGPMTAANIAMLRTVPEAQLGDLTAARAHAQEARTAMQEFQTTAWITFMAYIAMIALLADDPALAERELQGVVEQLGEAGEHAYASTVAALRARAQVELGRLDEAEQAARQALELAEQEDAVSQAYAHAALARALASDGRQEEALREGLLAVAAVEAADVPDIRADVYFDLARVHAANGVGERAEEAARAAQELYRAKGNEVGLSRVSAFLG
ncbi:MAG TPA: hypothetical protein VJ814_00495, partial [Gaiellaceae bacterium]|nr:hypothetical protein [Gaiellaceae bacterium]